LAHQVQRLGFGLTLFIRPGGCFLHPLEMLKPQRDATPPLGGLGSGVVDS